ncbi:MAG TPA: glycosyltransferase [Gaiellaceae bacterium]|nr:glycosyltransferase [Gaiellaceae bacterium]
MSAQRRAGVEVTERHVDLWRGRERLGPLAALRVAAAEVKLMIPRRRTFDAIVVGYPGHFDVPQARSFAGRGKPVVFLPRIALAHELIERRGRFRRRTLAARVLEATDARALKIANAVVADSDATAAYLAELGKLPRERVATIFAGAEERVFCERWSPVYPFGALHVSGPGMNLEVLLETARRVPDLPVRVVAPARADPPPNVEWLATPYEELGLAYAHAGVAIASLEASREIPQAAFHALATGTPLVTADTAAARELLDDETAVLVPPADADAAAEALVRVSSDEELRLRLSAAGRRLYEERASEHVLGARWRTLLERQVGIV